MDPEPAAASRPSRNTMAMRVTAQAFSGEEALARIQALVADQPDDIGLRFALACCFEDLARYEDAKRAYAEVLARDGTHFGALTNLGSLLHLHGVQTVSRALYTKALVEHPGEPMAYVNMGNALIEDDEIAAAEAMYHAGLRVKAEYPNLHFALSLLYREQGDHDSAIKHHQLTFVKPFVGVAPYYGKDAPLDVLLILAAHGGNVVTHPFFDRRVVRLYSIVAEGYQPWLELPAHHVVFNGIGDVDRSLVPLRFARDIVARSGAPVINHPDAVLTSSRADVTQRLAEIPGVRTPLTVALPRALVTEAELRNRGFTFPLLLRSPGHHTGNHFAWVETPADLAAVRDVLPGPELLAIAYLDGRGADRCYRKYRVLFIGGKLYPLHLAISPNWKVHYFSADMADRPDHREEEQRFLADMPAVLGARGIEALERIAATLALDYGGIDFGRDAAGNILLYESNATMAVFPPPPDEQFAYRREPVQRVLDAMKQLIVDTGVRGGYVAGMPAPV
jgi:glutathione synthase/RimK-type ligase-like ATP-grasp enzyme